MTVTEQIKILDGKIIQNEAQYNLDRKATKISALSSNNLDKYEYLSGEDLDLEPSTVEEVKFEYSPLGKIFNKGLDDKDDQKEGLLKRLKNIEKNQNSNNNDKNKKTNDISESSSARTESSKKTSISDDERERSVYSPNVANMKDINILEPGDATQTSFEYLKNSTDEFFGGLSKCF